MRRDNVAERGRDRKVVKNRQDCGMAQNEADRQTDKINKDKGKAAA